MMRKNINGKSNFPYDYFLNEILVNSFSSISIVISSPFSKTIILLDPLPLLPRDCKSYEDSTKELLLLISQFLFCSSFDLCKLKL